MINPALRIVFAGTPAFAAEHLAYLASNGANIVGVFTQPDRPVGRGKQILPTPVKEVALGHQIPVFQPEKLDADSDHQLRELAPDAMIVVAYGQILGENILEIPRYGCINVHASLLPRWRGAAPVERAILAGDCETGVSIMQMNAGLDTGDVLLKLATPIDAADDAGSIAERLANLGTQGLESVLSDLSTYQANAEKQDESLSTYAAKLTKEEAFIHWEQSAAVIHHQVQAFFPRSPAWCWLAGERLKILKAHVTDRESKDPPGTVAATDGGEIQVACGERVLSLSRLQLPGKKPASAKDILNGHRDLFTPGTILTGPGPT